MGKFAHVTTTQQNSIALTDLPMSPLPGSQFAGTDLVATPFVVGPAVDSIVDSPTDVANAPAISVPSACQQSAQPQAVTLPDVETTHVWGADFAVVTMADVIERANQIISARIPSYFITANLNYLMLTAEQPDLAKVNAQADMIIADGNPIVWRSTLTLQRLPERVAGSDMIVELAQLSAARGYRIYFLGAAPGVAQKAAEKLQIMFPGLQIAGCAAPPFRQLSAEEDANLIDTIQQSRPDILLVAFGQPKGERWIHENYQRLNIPLSIQLGASFDFLAGTAKRAPAFWQRLGCEWLYRSICEPKRLAPRYVKNIAFLCRRLVRDFT